MARMKLGSYTFGLNPSIYTPPYLMTPTRHVAAVKTYDSIAVFSWGSSITGKTIRLEWNYLPDSQYQEFQTMLLADTSLVFDPDDGSGKTFTCEIMNLEGRYHYKLKGAAGEDVWRSRVVLELLILSEVS